ncbi:MAG TPA: DoxX family protein [Planctomycetota bacterium]|nr:DoxX family protein [Planctomycetota bacterium]
MFGRDTSNCKVCAFCAQNSDIPLRAALAATFIAHGYTKYFVFGLDKFAGMLGSLGVPLPGVNAWLSFLAEFAGGILLILGLGTRVAAFGHIVVMLVAIFTVHMHQGFMMHVESGGAQPSVGGWEWQLALLCMALALLMRGAGPLSLDKTLLKNCCAKKE